MYILYTCSDYNIYNKSQWNSLINNNTSIVIERSYLMRLMKSFKWGDCEVQVNSRMYIIQNYIFFSVSGEDFFFVTRSLF